MSKDLKKGKESAVLMTVGKISQAKRMASAKTLWQQCTSQVPGMGQRPGGAKKNETGENGRTRGQR